MKILFHVSHEPEHLEATFPLARELERRDHEVVYTAIADLQPMIERAGFSCMPIHRSAVPRGTLAAFEQLATLEARAWAVLEFCDRIADDYFRGVIEADLRGLAPAIVVADVATISPIQLAAHRLGIPCLQLSLSLPQQLDELPPLTSPLLPDAPSLSLAGARWQASCLNRMAGPLRIPMIISAIVDRYAARFGYPARHVSFDAVLHPSLTSCPEVIACASSLDLPRTGAAPPFIAISLDLDRAENLAATLEAFVDGARPLVYVSLGATPRPSPRAARCFTAAALAISARPEWQMVIAAGRYADDPVFANLPNNALVMRDAPQLWLLRRAAVFVTHASLRDIREAIALHVPIIAVPQVLDEPGNAVRVAHHGIGIHLQPDSISCASLMTAIERSIVDASAYRVKLRAQDEACRSQEAEHRGIAIVERLAVARPFGAPNAAPEDLRSGWRFTDDISDPSTATRLLGLGEALASAEGCRLVHIENGSAWVSDASAMLYDYAAWCAAMALQPELEVSAERVEELLERIAQHQVLRRAGASAVELTAAFHAGCVQAVKHWHYGYGAAAYAMHPVPHKAAQLASIEAMLSLARHRVGEAAGTAAGAALCEQAYRELAATFDVELERRVSTLRSVEHGHRTGG